MMHLMSVCAWHAMKCSPFKRDCCIPVLLFQVNAVTVDGITPLFNACCSGSAACVNMLLEFGAKAQLGNHLASPIHEAVKRGKFRILGAAYTKWT